MKKVLLAIILLAVIVGVSYVKSVREKRQATNRISQGLQEHTQQIAQYQHRLDSLGYLVGQQEVGFAESVWRREMAYRLTYDSLVKIINLERQRADSLKGNLESVLSTGKPRKASVDSSQRLLSRHERILSYYKKRCRSLPKDLSPYEKRIALAEIKEQTARKFSISLKELDNLNIDSELVR